MTRANDLLIRLSEGQAMWWQAQSNSGWSDAEEKSLRDNEESRHKLDMISKNTKEPEKKKDLLDKRIVLSAEYEKLRTKKKVAEQKAHDKLMAGKKANKNA